MSDLSSSSASAPNLNQVITNAPEMTLSAVPEGYDALVLADLARLAAGETAGEGRAVLHIAPDAKRMAFLQKAVRFFAPDIEVLEFPAWDCLPYDRVSPNPALLAQRMATLAKLLETPKLNAPRLIITTINAASQRVPTTEIVRGLSFSAKPGQIIDTQNLIRFLSHNGYSRCSLVMEQGDFAVRGGIIDLFPPGADHPLRLDFFGDSLDAIRTFEPQTQRSKGQVKHIELTAASEVQLDEAAIARFRQGYIAAFGPATDADRLYEAIKAGARHQGMEHWLALFHEQLDTVFDYVPDALITLDHLVPNALQTRFEQVQDYYEARVEARDLAKKTKATHMSTHTSASAIKPLPPSSLFIMEKEWQEILNPRQVRFLSPFETAQSETRAAISFGARLGRNFAEERTRENVNIFDVLIEHIKTEQTAQKTVVLASWSEGAAARLFGLLQEHGLENIAQITNWQDVQTLRPNQLAICVLEIETGFETDTLTLISEQDVLGDRLLQRKRNKKAANFLTEATSLSRGDLVVHVDHGVARFDGLQTITVTGAPHDCLKLVYHGDDKLFLPVENIELLSRYGPDDVGAQLDRLGGASWQSRKAKLKNKLKDIAGELIKIAAERQMRQGEKLDVPMGIYDEFCTQFPFDETEDQLDAIEAVIEDMASGRPMDRLICGDVGFGKTEVALRATFIAAMNGVQVAIIAPTTLLAKQHARTFTARFAGLPVKVRELSRLVKSTQTVETKNGLRDGTVEIVIGTHALLGKEISFANLGLVIIDEEQRFGVTHKEQLKKLRTEVHILTLTATPIPRTLQLALTGVRDLSLIATPPIDRLAVRTYVTPFDPVVVREALLREKYRVGQSFFICPRITDIDEAADFLTTYVPEVKFVIAHGQMAGSELEARIAAFYDGQYDVLLSTSIIENGIDIPTANTMIIYRGDMFGLAQLYQMRGRVGRSKLRAYAYVTYQENKPLTESAEKRLRILQSLDSLGAGFTLASHDLDLRGAGNLLGEEQSGHVKEVGFELYQSMLEEAVAQQQGAEKDEAWSPQINIGTAVLLPESYIHDFEVRMGLYRRLSHLETPTEVEGFAAELIDRFGSLPQDAENLMQVISIKCLCRMAGIEKIDVGPKGAVLHFRKQQFSNPEGLVAFISDHATRVKLRPDHSLLYKMNFETDEQKLSIAKKLAGELSKLNS